MKREDLSPVTVRGYVSDLEMFYAWLEQSRGVRLGLSQITMIDLINYRQHLTAVKGTGTHR
jgi:site-specific recombinase XerD